MSTYKTTLKDLLDENRHAYFIVLDSGKAPPDEPVREPEHAIPEYISGLEESYPETDELIRTLREAPVMEPVKLFPNPEKTVVLASDSIRELIREAKTIQTVYSTSMFGEGDPIHEDSGLFRKTHFRDCSGS